MGRSFFAREQTGAKMMFARSQKNCALIVFIIFHYHFQKVIYLDPNPV